MFKSLPIENGTLFECSTGPFPYIARGFRQGSLSLEAGQEHIGMVARGKINVSDRDGTVRLCAGMYFSVGEALLQHADFHAQALVISASFHKGLRQFGGPLEEEGRLVYVDGCSDTLLLSPPRRGEPCLNHLHIPPHVSQRQHYHPSDRLGIIFNGSGLCRTETAAFDLTPGLAWQIPAGMNHCFATQSQALNVMTWHPETDFGPTDNDHPMINRTWTH